MPKDGDRIYLLIEGDKCFNALDPIQTLAEAIQIPKGHGRLIDADEIVKEYYINPTYPRLCTILNNAPTILEAEEQK